MVDQGIFGAGPGGRRWRALLVEDSLSTRRLMAELLAADGFEVFEAGSGSKGLELFDAVDPDVVLLDVRLPDVEGTDLMETIRKRRAVPVLLVTAKAEEADRVRGLDAGADDYVVKPFLPDELRARVRAAIRRARNLAPRERLVLDGLEIDVERRMVFRAGVAVDLRQKEFELLTALAFADGAVLSRDQLLREVWGTKDDWQDPATVTEHVRRVRLKIENDPERPRWILTVRGVGYRFGT